METLTTPTETQLASRWNKGNSADRARRVANLLSHWGDGTACECVWCGHLLGNFAHLASGAGHPDHVTADHILTHSEGGRYVMNNLVPACTTCNKSRGATPFRVWAERKGADAEALIAHAASYRRARQG